MLYLIQGVAFLDKNVFSLETETNSNWQKLFFSGKISVGTDGQAQGETIDRSETVDRNVYAYGHALLTNIRFSENELSFTKTHPGIKAWSGGTDPPTDFHYEYCLRRQGDLYVGEYSKYYSDGSIGPKGKAKCVVTEVPDDFFLKP